MSERPPLSRLDDSGESRALANTADGVPEHLRDHLHVPDKEVFSLKAQLKALQTVLEGAKKQRDEALRVAASATARCDSFEERAAGRLEKARTRAETAERRADASERRADLGEKASAMLEKRAEEAEAKLDETRRVAEDLRRRLDEQVATNASLQEETTVFRARVRDLERGVPTRESATQTTEEDAAAAARAGDRDRVDPDEVGIRANAARWLRELEAVGAPPTLDTASGAVSRATARTHLTPPGLGIDLAPPAAPPNRYPLRLLCRRSSRDRRRPSRTSRRRPDRATGACHRDCSCGTEERRYRPRRTGKTRTRRTSAPRTRRPR